MKKQELNQEEMRHLSSVYQFKEGLPWALAGGSILLGLVFSFGLAEVAESMGLIYLRTTGHAMIVIGACCAIYATYCGIMHLYWKKRATEGPEWMKAVNKKWGKIR